MAYAIFEQNDLVKIASDDTEKNGLVLTPSNEAVTISDSDFTALQEGTKEVASRDGNTITYSTPDAISIADANIYKDEYITPEVDSINNWLDSASAVGHSKRSAFISYRDALLAIDTSSITFPTTQDPKAKLKADGTSILSTLQLP